MNNSALTENFNSEIYVEEKKQSLDIFENTNLFKAERATRSKREKMIKNDIKGYLFSIWPFVGYCIFALFPFVLSIYLSMCDLHVWNLNNATWVGFDNFIFLLFSSNSQFWWSLMQTLYYFLSLPMGIFLGLGSAVLLTSRIKAKKFFRTTLYIPNVCSAVGVTMMWQVIFDRNFGIVNSIITNVFGGEAISWFTTPELFMPLVLFTTTWSSGSGCLLFQAALEQVNQSLVEAAKIDGANKKEIFFNVTMPAISPTTFYVLTMNTIGALQAIGPIQLFSQAGSPSGYGPAYGEGPFEGKYAGMVTVYYVYMMGIGGGSEGQGKSSAAAWLLAMLILAITRLNFKLQDKWVSYDN